MPMQFFSVFSVFSVVHLLLDACGAKRGFMHWQSGATFAGA